jgi:hypothetical protein
MIMNTAENLSQIEENIGLLSREEQLWLIERMIHRLRQGERKEKASLESQLEAMAADPEIQRELQNIDEEFRVTEADGLRTL